MSANRSDGFANYGIGIGLRILHYGHIPERRPVVDWFEIVPENYMVGGGRALATLEPILDLYAIVQHGVSIYSGSAAPLNRDHLCRGSVDGTYIHDLLLMFCTFEAAEVTARSISRERVAQIHIAGHSKHAVNLVGPAPARKAQRYIPEPVEAAR